MADRMGAGYGWLVVVVCGALLGAAPVAAQGDVDVQGAWRAKTYLLADGTVHTVDGLIVFTERDWTVLFFVTGPDGQPRRGSGEGGSYTLSGDRLVFTHLYNLSAGDEMDGLPASDLRMIVRGAAGAPEEACRVARDADHLTVFFPSGNAMTFRRSS